MHGRILDFEGIDGTGKSTQAKLLVDYLNKNKRKYSFYKFPQYKKTIYGKMVADFLAGKLGNLKEVNPYLVSLTYALDRAAVAEKIKKEKNEGKIVVFDRYVSSTKAHQASRLNKKAAEKFMSWLDDLEYKVNRMPREDIIILLDMPVSNSLKLIDERKKDLLEQKDLQEQTRKVYLDLAKSDSKRWLIINCIDEKGKLKSRDKVHKEVVEILSQKNII